MKIGTRVKIVADDVAAEKKIESRYIGQTGVVIGYKPNEFRDDADIPMVRLDSGLIVASRALWYEKVSE